jgi:preflagellin peptidase FlaK
MYTAALPWRLTVAEALKIAVVLLALTYTSWLDLRTREVEPKLWLYFSTLLLAVSLLESPLMLGVLDESLLLIQLLGGALAVGLMAALYYAGMMGGGDLFASTMILAAHPWPPLLRPLLLPFLLDILVYSAISFLVIVPLIMIYNILFHRDDLRRLERLRSKLVAAATGIPVRVGDYVRSSSWLFPLEDYRSGERMFRHSFDIDEEPDEHRRMLRRLLEEGRLTFYGFSYI